MVIRSFLLRNRIQDISSAGSLNIVEFSPDKIHDVVQKPEDQAMVDRYVKQLTDHVLETRVVPPLFNLQWLYDLTFDEKKVLHLEED